MHGHVTIIQHVEPEGPGVTAEVLLGRGGNIQLIRIHGGHLVPSSIDGMAGLVVMGGPMSVHDVAHFPYLAKVRRLIDMTLQARLPVLGVCLGSQMLASVLGAPVRTGARKEIGWHQVTLSDAADHDALFADVSRTFEAFHWHGDVFDLPAGAVSLASSEATACQAFRWRANAYGLLFHLEVDASAIRNMAAAFAQELAEIRLEPRRLLQDVNRRAAALRRIATAVFDRWADMVVQCRF